MPDVYSDELQDTLPDIEFVDPDAPSGDKLTGFDPYDTVKTHQK